MNAVVDAIREVFADAVKNPVVMTFGIITVCVGPILVWRVASWIARPLDLAAKNRRHPTQFTIVDFLCLFVLVQAPTALIHSIKTGGATGISEYEPFLLDAYAWAAIGVIWWKAAQITSRAGINTPWHRVVLLLVVLPTALVGPLLPFVFAIVTAIGMIRFHSPAKLAATVVCMAIGVPVAAIISARLVRRIAAASGAVIEVAGPSAEDAHDRD
jgi:hypothetical protein